DRPGPRPRAAGDAAHRARTSRDHDGGRHEMSAQPIEHATTRPVAGGPAPAVPRSHRPPAGPGVVTPLHPRNRPAVGPALPRTSTARPWDRVRFVAHVPRPDILSGDEGEPPPLAPAPEASEGDRVAAAVAAGAIEALLGV